MRQTRRRIPSPAFLSGLIVSSHHIRREAGRRQSGSARRLLSSLSAWEQYLPGEGLGQLPPPQHLLAPLDPLDPSGQREREGSKGGRREMERLKASDRCFPRMG